MAKSHKNDTDVQTNIIKQDGWELQVVILYNYFDCLSFLLAIPFIYGIYVCKEE